MTAARADQQSLTHTGSDHLSREDISVEFDEIKKRLNQEFDSDKEKLVYLLKLLDDLADFELGRFMIKHKSLSGYWTYYVIMGFKNHQITSTLEEFLVTQSPAFLSTQKRFTIFQTLLSDSIQSNSVVCSVPCGMMADLLTLKLPKEVEEVRFVGIDLDGAVFDLAKALAQQFNVRNHFEFFKRDAWKIGEEFKEKFNVITSNGLNIYESDNSKVVALYQGMYNALQDNGYLICSALTPPSTWFMEQIDQKHLATAVAIMNTILKATWSNFRTWELTWEQLHMAGFENVEVHWDPAHIFPTFRAQKIIHNNELKC